MSKFLSARYAALTPYTPGEQPKDNEYVKLNTNESPYPLPQSAVEGVAEEVARLRLYNDPENTELTALAAETLRVKPSQVLMTNGSDEAINFAFMAFCDERQGIAFPDITYGFYKVFAGLYRIPYREIPLKENFSVDYQDYLGLKEHIVLANPNAPTGLCLSLEEIEKLLQANPDRVVIIDEAYVDFGGVSCVPLIEKYGNLLVTQTFSKSRSLAGGRLGMAIGSEGLIEDLKMMKYSTNPYNVNRLTAAAGKAALQEKAWFEGNVKEIIQTRAYTAAELKKLGFEVLDSKANFLFARTDEVSGQALYEGLKNRGVLVRHFTGERIKDFNRITVGTKAQMDIFLSKVKEILEEGK